MYIDKHLTAKKRMKKRRKPECRMENQNSLKDFPFDFVGPNSDVPKWSIKDNPDPKAPIICEGMKPQIQLEARHSDGRVVDGQVQQKRTYNLKANVIKQMPPSGLKTLLLTMKLGDVAWRLPDK